MFVIAGESSAVAEWTVRITDCRIRDCITSCNRFAAARSRRETLYEWLYTRDFIQGGFIWILLKYLE